MSEVKEARNAAIIAYVAAGKTRTAAARKWGVSRTRINQIVNPTLGVYPGYNPLAGDERARIIDLAKSGFCVAHIAEQVGRAESTVQRCLSRAGVTPHNQGDTFGPDKRMEALSLLATGLNAREVAARLAMTRNAVIGASWRARKKQEAAP